MDIEVVFEDKLNRITCATLLTEAIKYLIFHRYQIPLPFDQFKAEDERDRKEDEKSSIHPANRPSSLAVKKKRQLITDIEELVCRIFQAFIQVEIFDVLLLFGSTVVNPKEIYSIRFPIVGRVTEADRLKSIDASGKENGLAASRSKFVDKCCRKLARTLFTDQNLNECGELKCTTINCFVLASRFGEIDWFKPKATFKVPKKGKFYSINVSESGSATKNRDVGDVEGEEVQEDTMWFHAPVTLRGYKEAYKETAGSSIWGK